MTSRDTKHGWALLQAEAEDAFVGRGRFPLRAYSEFMPSPAVGLKPVDPARSRASCTAAARENHTLDITEAEQVEELTPGLERIASHLVTEIAKLARGTTRVMSKTLLEGNPAWPKELIDAAARHGFRNETFSIAMPLALSRTQDDKGNVRWTLFGGSHEGAAAPFWASFGDSEGDRFARVISWMTAEELPLDRIRVLPSPGQVLPAFTRSLLLEEKAPLDAVRALVTHLPFAQLPERVRQAYLTQKLLLAPSPAGQVFFAHPRYAELSRTLPHAMQIPLLHLFPRVQGGYAIRIPQSGWLDEHEAGHEGYAGGHRIVSSIVRTHRWEKVERDQGVGGDMSYADHVTTALFSTDPDDVGLYGKPMARNAQIWSEGYGLILDGPRADKAQLQRAAHTLREGGRFGYRLFYPPMRGGVRELFWHLPLVARLRPESRHVTRMVEDAPLGYVTAELSGAKPVRLMPRLLARPLHTAAATLFPRDPGHARNTTAHNVRKVLDFAALHGGPLPAPYARALLQIPKHATYEEWLTRLGEIAAHPHQARPLLTELRALAAGKAEEVHPLTFEETANRDHEERLWNTIASLAEGQFHGKENADAIAVNKGRTGGAAAKLARVTSAEKRDLGKLGDHLHREHNALIKLHGMDGRAEVVDHAFRWETDFDFAWSQGWANNQTGKATERNIVVVIPGKNRGEAVVMADHYDTAYMEDVYEEARGGDKLRAAAHGADDNHSGTASLLLAANVLLPLSRAGKLERDVWLVHLTGEEFPSDCMGARALAQALVERSLSFVRPSGEAMDVSKVKLAGVYVLDMVAHNNMRDRDSFFICAGEGAASANLARRAHLANMQWNATATAANGKPDRVGKARAQRMPDGKVVPPPFAHLPVLGNVAAEWEPRSVLYNTDGQIFSDVGVPVVLFMENYDINRSGYHDTHDTMANIDLDYAAAISAIAIEAVAQLATAKEL
jgi:hypothetical protein